MKEEKPLKEGVPVMPVKFDFSNMVAKTVPNESHKEIPSSGTFTLNIDLEKMREKEQQIKQLRKEKQRIRKELIEKENAKFKLINARKKRLKEIE